MITKARYDKLRRKIGAFDAWVETIRDPKTGWAKYCPSDVPKGLPQPSNQERSQVEVFEFVTQPPDKYFVYVERNLVTGNEVDNRVTITTWTGQILGYGYLGKPYRCGASRRYPVSFKGINGFLYRGTYYASAGTYARVKRVKA